MVMTMFWLRRKELENKRIEAERIGAERRQKVTIKDVGAGGGRERRREEDLGVFC